MQKFVKALLIELKSSAVVMTFFVLAAAILATPIQLHFPISRIQHFGLASFTAGLGYIVQTVWSWKTLRLWARLIQCYFGIWFGTVGLVLYGNPWLEPEMAIRTESQEELRSLVVRSIGFLAMPIPFLGLMWIREELNARRKPDKDLCDDSDKRSDSRHSEERSDSRHSEERSDEESPS